MVHSHSQISYKAGMADGGKNSPTAISALKIGVAAGFNSMPVVNAAGSVTGD